MSIFKIAKQVTGALLAAGLLSGAAHAEDKKDIVLGGSIPMTGVFAFAGVGIHAGITDATKIINDNGGIEGHKLVYVPEDTAYKVDASVAAFNKITSQHDVNLYYGDSTAFSKTISPEVDRLGKMVLTGASFASELNDTKKFPNIFIPGPTYTDMIGILLNHIAKEKPGAKVGLVHSETEFGRDPVEGAKATAKELGLDMSLIISTAPGGVDVSTEVLKIRRARPDFVIFHGYVLAPIPEFISQARAMGLKTKFMGTFWSMDNSMVGKMGDVADGFMGVMPYNYYYSEQANAPMLDKIRSMRDTYQSNAYMQGFFSTMMLSEAVRNTIKAGKELNGPNIHAGLQQIKDFDTGGIIGVPVSVKGNSVPIGRVYQYDLSKKQMVPASDWIRLD
ncbi:MAG: ABC transporter substrate-binding protein [Methylocystaceae bacterium]|nr:ABC transporter substrate-binding protein [Methylocystaceae bacterium]